MYENVSDGNTESGRAGNVASRTTMSDVLFRELALQLRTKNNLAMNAAFPFSIIVLMCVYYYVFYEGALY